MSSTYLYRVGQFKSVPTVPRYQYVNMIALLFLLERVAVNKKYDCRHVCRACVAFLCVLPYVCVSCFFCVSQTFLSGEDHSDVKCPQTERDMKDETRDFFHRENKIEQKR